MQLFLKNVINSKKSTDDLLAHESYFCLKYKFICITFLMFV